MTPPGCQPSFSFFHKLFQKPFLSLNFDSSKSYHPDPDDIINLNAEDPCHRNEIIDRWHVPSGFPLGHSNRCYSDPVCHLCHGHSMCPAHICDVPTCSGHINTWHGHLPLSLCVKMKDRDSNPQATGFEPVPSSFATVLRHAPTGIRTRNVPFGNPTVLSRQPVPLGYERISAPWRGAEAPVELRLAPVLMPSGHRLGPTETKCRPGAERRL